MCKGGGDLPPPPELPAAQRALMDNLYLSCFGPPLSREPSDYQPKPKPHPKPKPNPLDFGVPDLDLD